MRILDVCPCLPWPLNSGGNAGVFSSLKYLSEDHDFTLVCPIYDERQVPDADQLQAELPRVKVRVVHCFESAPKPSLPVSAARKAARFGRRMLMPPPQIQNGATNSPQYPFNPLPKKLIVAIHEEVQRGVDLFQLEFAEMLPLAAWLPKNIPKLFVHHQIHFVYAERFAETRPDDSYSRYLTEVMRVQEHLHLRDYDAVITMSEQDRQVLLPYVRAEQVFASPSPIPSDVKITEDNPPAFDGRFLFVASEDHAPNVDAFKWLLAEIWPAILQKLPNSKLYVVGKWSEAAKTQSSSQSVIFTGFVPDLAKTLRGGILLVPLRIGSGIRMKIMVAMALGVPVVSTSVGGEGMLLKDGEHLLVGDSVKEFADAAVRLSKDPALHRRLAEAGRAIVSKNFSPEGFRRRRNEIYAVLAGSGGRSPQKPRG